jgi:YidC/Oxa1 family membrane protein insertase
VDTRRFLLAIALSIGVLLLWGQLVKPKRPPAGAPSELEAGGSPAAAPTAPPAPVALSAAPEEPDGRRTEEAAPPIEAPEEERIEIETTTAVAVFTNRGAQLVSFRLKEHLGEDGQGLDLVRARAQGPFPFGLVTATGDPLPVNDALFAVERQGDGAEPALVFHYRGPLGSAEKRFAFRGNGLFGIDVQYSGREPWAVFLGPGLRNPTAKEASGQFAFRSAVYALGGKVERRAAAKAAKAEALGGAGLAWVGLDDSYFLTVVLPESRLRIATLSPVLVEPGAAGQAARFTPVPPSGEAGKEQKELLHEWILLLEPEGGRLVASTFWGAKQYERLAKLPGGLERTVDLGWFWFLARPLMLGLRWLYEDVVGNYGWAIVIMTVFINLVLLPFTHKSMVSMRKMQELAPRMQAIRQKWAGKLKDKQGRPNAESQRKMNEEVMALYKSEGVNPAAGCLPMVLQIPVFFAFYKILYVSVELRHAPWILWVADLSAPFWPLAVVMGATQFVQTAMMPATGNPMQRRVMMLMPIFFTVLFLGFPSGLVLYWLTNNVLGIARQAVYNRMGIGRPAAAAVAGKKAASGKGEAERAS